jgi:hypothetical protein
MSLVLPVSRVLAMAISLALLADLPLLVTSLLLLLITLPICTWVALLYPSTPEIGTLASEIVFGSSLGAATALPLLAANLGGALSLSRIQALQTIVRLVICSTLFLLSWERSLLSQLAESFVEIRPGKASLPISLNGIGTYTKEALRWGSELGWPLLTAVLVAEALGALATRVAPALELRAPRELISLLGLFASLSAIANSLARLLHP